MSATGDHLETLPPELRITVITPNFSVVRAKRSVSTRVTVGISAAITMKLPKAVNGEPGGGAARSLAGMDRPLPGSLCVPMLGASPFALQPALPQSLKISSRPQRSSSGAPPRAPLPPLPS